MNKQDRRVAKRVPATFSVSYIHEGDYLISHCRDISVDGMFLNTRRPAEVGSETTITFSIGSLNNVAIRSTVVWFNHSDSEKDCGMAVKFINPETELTHAILEIINRVAVLD